MSSTDVYAFEGIDDRLPYMPLAARRALDAYGRKLSLEGWHSLSPEDRRRLVRAGAAAVVEADGLPAVDAAVPAAEAITPGSEPDAATPPAGLLEMLGPTRPLDAARWASLRPLDRYALVKCSGKSRKLARAYDGIVRGFLFSHVSEAGDVQMVDVGAKSPTARRALGSATVRTTRAVVEAVASGSIAKGDVLAVARVAGILAAKRTSELIPLCHPVQTTRVTVDVELDMERGELHLRADVEAFDRTGVEMEAMVAASIAALAVYDMVKSADPWATIDAVQLEAKSGGKSGAVARPARGPRR